MTDGLFMVALLAALVLRGQPETVQNEVGGNP
jgi:hypothetical protein